MNYSWLVLVHRKLKYSVTVRCQESTETFETHPDYMFKASEANLNIFSYIIWLRFAKIVVSLIFHKESIVSIKSYYTNPPFWRIYAHSQGIAYDVFLYTYMMTMQIYVHCTHLLLDIFWACFLNSSYLENKLLWISINLKPIKPAIQLPKTWY